MTANGRWNSRYPCVHIYPYPYAVWLLLCQLLQPGIYLPQVNNSRYHSFLLLFIPNNYSKVMLCGLVEISSRTISARIFFQMYLKGEIILPCAWLSRPSTCRISIQVTEPNHYLNSEVTEEKHYAKEIYFIFIFLRSHC